MNRCDSGIRTCAKVKSKGRCVVDSVGTARVVGLVAFVGATVNLFATERVAPVFVEARPSASVSAVARSPCEPDIQPLAYARGSGGFLVAMHDVVREVGERHGVPTFEPASSHDPASELRLVNGDEDAAITITGTDDLGQAAPAGAISLTLAAQEARTITARQLEEGGTKLVGALGDGNGKWRLAVAADAPIRVMNLLRGADGRMSNLSTSPMRSMRRE